MSFIDDGGYTVIIHSEVDSEFVDWFDVFPFLRQKATEISVGGDGKVKFVDWQEHDQREVLQHSF